MKMSCASTSTGNIAGSLLSDLVFCAPFIVGIKGCKRRYGDTYIFGLRLATPKTVSVVLCHINVNLVERAVQQCRCPHGARATYCCAVFTSFCCGLDTPLPHQPGLYCMRPRLADTAIIVLSLVLDTCSLSSPKGFHI